MSDITPVTMTELTEAEIEAVSGGQPVQRFRGGLINVGVQDVNVNVPIVALNSSPVLIPIDNA